MFRRAGEEGLAGGQVCSEGESEACEISEGGDDGVVVDVDAGVCLKELHSEEVGCCCVVSATSFKKCPLQQPDFWP